MSALLLKIAKVIPRLDSDHEAEQLAAISIIRKLLASNMDDEHSPPRPAPLKFVDVGEQLKSFVASVLEAEDEEEVAVNTVNNVATPPPPQPFTPSFRPAAGTQTPPRPAQRPPRPFGNGWIWDDTDDEWVQTHPPIHNYFAPQWGHDASHWMWNQILEEWIRLPVPTPTPQPAKPTAFHTPSWHEVTTRSVHDYEKRCKFLIDSRAFKNSKEKDFLESCYFRLSNGQALTTGQLKWFHDISNRKPF